MDIRYVDLRLETALYCMLPVWVSPGVHVHQDITIPTQADMYVAYVDDSHTNTDYLTQLFSLQEGFASTRYIHVDMNAHSSHSAYVDSAAANAT